MQAVDNNFFVEQREHCGDVWGLRSTAHQHSYRHSELRHLEAVLIKGRLDGCADSAGSPFSILEHRCQVVASGQGGRRQVLSAIFLRRRHREDFLYVLNESTDLIANYIVGNVVISLIAGVVAFTGFQIIGVRFALVLAAWVALTDLIPIVGAFIGAAGVAAVAAFQGPGVVIAAVALLLVYQLVENFLIAPRVMNRAVDLSPVAVIVAILIGGSLAGLFGALLALPVAAMIKVIVFELIIPERLDDIRKDGPAEGVQRSRRRATRALP